MNIRVNHYHTLGLIGQNAAEKNSTGKWHFQTYGWGFTWVGSYKQACLMARKDYSRLYDTSFGEINLVGYKPTEKQTQLSLDI